MVVGPQHEDLFPLRRRVRVHPDREAGDLPGAAADSVKPPRIGVVSIGDRRIEIPDAVDVVDVGSHASVIHEILVGERTCLEVAEDFLGRLTQAANAQFIDQLQSTIGIDPGVERELV